METHYGASARRDRRGCEAVKALRTPATPAEKTSEDDPTPRAGEQGADPDARGVPNPQAPALAARSRVCEGARIARATRLDATWRRPESLGRRASRVWMFPRTPCRNCRRRRACTLGDSQGAEMFKKPPANRLC